MTDYPILVPKALSENIYGIAPGSAIIAIRETEMENHYVMYYEGNLNEACNLHEFDEKCYVAASRGITKYPTTAFCVGNIDNFHQIGTFNYENKTVNLSHPDMLEEWEYDESHDSYMKP